MLDCKIYPAVRGQVLNQDLAPIANPLSSYGTSLLYIARNRTKQKQKRDRKADIAMNAKDLLELCICMPACRAESVQTGLMAVTGPIT